MLGVCAEHFNVIYKLSLFPLHFLLYSLLNMLSHTLYMSKNLSMSSMLTLKSIWNNHLLKSVSICIFASLFEWQQLHAIGFDLQLNSGKKGKIYSRFSTISSNIVCCYTKSLCLFEISHFISIQPSAINTSLL